MDSVGKENYDLPIFNESFLILKYEVQKFVNIRISVKDELDLKHVVILTVHLLNH